ncbi:MAG: PTS sugar transporter subunit IIB [Elusimicrobiota bacterium]
MAVELLRVDDRLVHGQVVEGWVPELKINEIAVISDEIFSDEIRKSIMRFSVPENVNLIFLKVEEAAENLEVKQEDGSLRVLALFSNLKDAYETLKKMKTVKTLNIGGIHYSAGKNFSLGKAIFLSEEDCFNLRKIDELGVKIEGRGVPHDKPSDILQSIK